MNGTQVTRQRRKAVERNIYRSVNAAGQTVYEVGYRDSTQTQRWRTVHGGISAARRVRDEILGDKAKGVRVQPNPRLRFQDAANRWLADQVCELRPATRAGYEVAVRVHLAPRWGRRRLDGITVDDAAQLVRELRTGGKSEWTIATILKVASRVFKFAARRMHWHGVNPIPLLEVSEGPKVSATQRRRIYEGDELAQTLAATGEPWRTLFTFAAIVGARLSECLGLRWSDLDLSTVTEASVTFTAQVDRDGHRQPLKTRESERTVELPRSLAVILLEHKARARNAVEHAFVFATRSGRPLGQRNVLRELRRAQRAARTPEGNPTFPALQLPGPPPRDAAPTFHGFRHTAASEAIADGDSVEEVSWQLGHRNSNVTRAVYVQEVKSAERAARRRGKMQHRLEEVLAAQRPQTTSPTDGTVVELRRRAVN